MKKIVAIVLVATTFTLAGNKLQAQQQIRLYQPERNDHWNARIQKSGFLHGGISGRTESEF